MAKKVTQEVTFEPEESQEQASYEDLCRFGELRAAVIHLRASATVLHALIACPNAKLNLTRIKQEFREAKSRIEDAVQAIEI